MTDYDDDTHYSDSEGVRFNAPKNVLRSLEEATTRATKRHTRLANALRHWDWENVSLEKLERVFAMTYRDD